jgi:hypothetical protein
MADCGDRIRCDDGADSLVGDKAYAGGGAGVSVVEGLLVVNAGLVWWFGTKISERLSKLIRMQGGIPPGEK